LSAQQPFEENKKKRTSHFEKKLEILEGDARNFGFNTKIKGLVLSNELIDEFAVHKVIMNPQGSVEVGYVIPGVDKSFLAGFFSKRKFPEALKQQITETDPKLREQFGLNDEAFYYLNKENFDLLMLAVFENFKKEYPSFVKKLKFFETYLPLKSVPQIDSYMQAHLEEFSQGMRRVRDKSVVVYPNTDSAKYIDQIGQILEAGYLVTIDYGNSIHALFRFLRNGQTVKLLRTMKNNIQGLNPFEDISLQDLTLDIGFSELAKNGEERGFVPVHFGPQQHLETETSISLRDIPYSEFRQYQERIKERGDIDQKLSKLIRGYPKQNRMGWAGRAPTDTVVNQLIELLPKDFIRAAHSNNNIEDLKKTLREHLIGSTNKAFYKIEKENSGRWSKDNDVLYAKVEDELKNSLLALYNSIVERSIDEFRVPFLESTAINNAKIYGPIKILVQKKEGTDPGFVFSSSPQDELFFPKENSSPKLDSPKQAEIEKSL